MKISSFVVLTAIFLSLPVITMGEEKPLVQIAGLQVVGPGYGLNGTELQAFHHQSGITLSLAVQSPDNKKIVEVNNSKCSLVEFTDDFGRNLLEGIRWGAFPKITKDNRFALVEVVSKNRPSLGASRLIVKGTIQLRVATSERTEKIENLKLQVGTKFTIREEEIQVMKVQKENGSLTLVMQINRKLKNNMKDIRFFIDQANPVDIRGRGSFTFGSVSQMEYDLDTKLKPETLKVEIDLWQGIELLNLPFRLESGLGI